MNAERMHAVAKRLKMDLDRTTVIPLLEQLRTATRNAVNAPQDPNYLNQVADFRTRIAAALASSDVNDFSPVERQVLSEWGLSEALGDELASKIEAIFTANQITMATAADQLDQLYAPLSQLSAQLESLLTGLSSFHIGSEELGSGEFEVDFLIPRPAVKNELNSLGSELQNIHDLLLPFIELTTGSRPPIEVRSIGSSDFTLFLLALPPAAACIATAVQKVLTAYQTVLTIRLTKLQIESLELPNGDEAKAAATEPLESFANGVMANAASKIATELAQEFAIASLPTGRRNELEIEMRHSLTAIAGRIDEGYNISVRTGPLPPPPTEEESGTEAAAVAKYAGQVQAASKALQYMNLSGSPILSLPPESDSPGDRAANG